MVPGFLACGFVQMLVIVLFDIQQVNYPIYTLFISGG